MRLLEVPMDPLAIFDALDCSVCFERLNETCKVLPCQHTFCKGCLKAIVASRRELRCPECRLLVSENVDELPPNIMLIRLLEGFKDCQTKKCTAQSTRSEVSLDEPCARAKYNYNARDRGDLNIKKGDLIVLLQKVDENWFFGEISGQQGYLPANFVEVINPLPEFEETDLPLARGLFDFEEEDEEEDLLHFKQGDIISVLQRIDSDWCEGEIGDRCGIFPFSFVKLNRSGSLLVSAQCKDTKPGEETRRRPCIPQETPEIRQPRRKAQLHHPVKRSRSIPRENAENRRRHHPDFGQTCSDSNVRSSFRVPKQANRHSFDVLSSADRCREFYSPDDSSDALPLATANVAVSRRRNGRFGEGSQENQLGATSPSSTWSSPTAPQRTDANRSSDLYIALYDYRPQKIDEIELCSGEHYKVLETGSDGWFKGFPVLRRQQVGHFPGNYVRLVRSGDSSDGNTEETETSLFRRRRHKNNFQSSLNPDSEVLVVARPRPFSDISSESNQDTGISPPLTPPLVGSKSHRQSLFRRLSMGKKKDRSCSQTAQSDRGIQQTEPTETAGASSVTARTTSPTPSSRTQINSVPSSRMGSNNKEKYVVVANYPPQSSMELELRCGDIVYVIKKTDNGWYHGTLERNGKVGFVPRSFLQYLLHLLYI